MAVTAPQHVPSHVDNGDPSAEHKPGGESVHHCMSQLYRSCTALRTLYPHRCRYVSPCCRCCASVSYRMLHTVLPESVCRHWKLLAVAVPFRSPFPLCRRPPLSLLCPCVAPHHSAIQRASEQRTRTASAASGLRAPYRRVFHTAALSAIASLVFMTSQHLNRTRIAQRNLSSSSLPMMQH